MIRFEIAKPVDSEKLIEVQVKTFDDDSRRVFNRPSGGPPNYDSKETLLSTINNNIYYKILNNDDIVGGINICVINNEHYELQTIFVDPEIQNKGVGQQSMKFIEEQFPQVKKWTLDTPSPCIRNHHLYEKMGYQKTNEMLLVKELSLYLYFYEKNL